MKPTYPPPTTLAAQRGDSRWGRGTYVRAGGPTSRWQTWASNAPPSHLDLTKVPWQGATLPLHPALTTVDPFILSTVTFDSRGPCRGALRSCTPRASTTLPASALEPGARTRTHVLGVGRAVESECPECHRQLMPPAAMRRAPRHNPPRTKPPQGDIDLPAPQRPSDASHIAN